MNFPENVTIAFSSIRQEHGAGNQNFNATNAVARERTLVRPFVNAVVQQHKRCWIEWKMLLCRTSAIYQKWKFPYTRSTLNGNAMALVVIRPSRCLSHSPMVRATAALSRMRTHSRASRSPCGAHTITELNGTTAHEIQFGASAGRCLCVGMAMSQCFRASITI